jgi:hypothetical protein
MSSSDYFLLYYQQKSQISLAEALATTFAGLSSIVKQLT